MLAREVRERCKGRVDPMVMQCIEMMAEEATHAKMSMIELAKMLDKVMDMLAVTQEMMGQSSRNVSKVLNDHGVSVESEPDPTQN